MLLPGPQNDRGAPLSTAPGKDAWAEPDVRRREQRWAAGAILSPERPAPGWEGAPRPLRPPPTPARGKQQEPESLPLPIQAGAQLPLPWPGRRALCKGRAPRRAEPSPARPGVEREGRSLPEPTPPGTAAWSRGDSWAGESPAAAAGRHPPVPARRLLPLPGAPAAAPGGACPAGGAGCQAAEFRVPSASQLSSWRVLLCFPVVRADARAAMAVFYPLQV